MKKSFIKRLTALALVIVSLFSITAMASAETMYVDGDIGVGSTVRIRKAANTSAGTWISVTYGTALDAEYDSSGWYAVSYTNPKTGTTYNGYMMSEFLADDIPTDCAWIALYGTVDHRYTDRVKTGCAALQDALNEALGLNLVEDGICGNATVAAIRQFQQQYGLSVDGVAGNRTKEYLYKVTH